MPPSSTTRRSPSSLQELTSRAVQGYFLHLVRSPGLLEGDPGSCYQEELFIVHNSVQGRTGGEHLLAILIYVCMWMSANESLK